MYPPGRGRGPAPDSMMAVRAGLSVLLLSVTLQRLGGMATAKENTLPVWTWLDGSLLQDQPSLLTAGQQYPGCRADASVWTTPSSGLAWMFGGREGSGQALSDLWEYSMPKAKWVNWRRGKEHEWPSARYAAALCGVEGSTLVLYGGRRSEGGGHLEELWLHHFHNESWTLASPTGVRPRLGRILSHWCTPDALWVYGGGTGSSYPASLWKLSLHSYQWERPLGGADIGRGAPSSDIGLVASTWVLNRTQLYVLAAGGNLPSDCSSCPTSETVARSQCHLWRLSPDAKEWGKVASESRDAAGDGGAKGQWPSCSAAHIASWPGAGNCLWLLSQEDSSISSSSNGSTGGATAGVPSPKLTLWRFDVGAGSWTLFEHTGSLTGQQQQQQQQQQRGDRVYDEGTQVAPSQPTPRASCASWSWNHTFYLFGGLAWNGNAGTRNDLWAFRLMGAGALPWDPAHALAVPPVGVFFISLGGLCFLSAFVFGVIFFTKCSSGPRLKPPNHFGDKIRYSPVETNDIFIT